MIVRRTLARASSLALPVKGLHQAGRGGVVFALRRRPVVEARPAADTRC